MYFLGDLQWNIEHRNGNICVQQSHHNVDYSVKNDRCNIDGALNHVDANMDMIVYKVDRPWTPHESDSQTSIDIEVVNNIS